MFRSLLSCIFVREFLVQDVLYLQYNERVQSRSSFRDLVICFVLISVFTLFFDRHAEGWAVFFVRGLSSRQFTPSVSRIGRGDFLSCFSDSRNVVCQRLFRGNKTHRPRDSWSAFSAVESLFSLIDQVHRAPTSLVSNSVAQVRCKVRLTRQTPLCRVRHELIIRETSITKLSKLRFLADLVTQAVEQVFIHNNQLRPHELCVMISQQFHQPSQSKNK